MSARNRVVRAIWLCLFLISGVIVCAGSNALTAFGQTMSNAGMTDESFLKQLQFRLLGPYRGGRSAAVEGVVGQPSVFYMGSCGGGVWRTNDGGNTWNNISDGYFGGSIGAVAVAPSDPKTIYVGGGEKTVRGNVSSGEGMWKSTDAGKSWQHVGLLDTRHIARIRIHPQDPNTVYVAAMGHLYGPNEERGVFRSRDGGQSWQRVLFVNPDAGAVDLNLDPLDPKVIYASTWRIRRTPYSLESGGDGSGLWKSADGGDTWTDITRNSGLPQGDVGIIGVAASPVMAGRVWAIIESLEGGLYRSDDGGQKWQKINDDRELRQRAWYYTRVYADPLDANTVYVLNVSFLKSTDNGKSFQSISTPHGDHHDLWIDPQNSSRMIVADDGGAQISFNGGETFSSYENQPTAQFYRVTTDNHFPYRIYGAQQDNSTVRILHRTDRGALDERSWESTAGGESGHLAPDPLNPDVVYGGSYGGYLTREDHRTGESRNINVWPDNPMGYGAGDLKYRFQWNFPIFFSPNNPRQLYAAANVLFRTENEGQTWQAISPDLTRNDPSKLGPSGGPITKDNTSVEYYATIFAAAESHHAAGTIWTGSDDGLIHVTVDDGKNWTNVTPAEMPEWAQINSVEVHPFEPGGLYVAATRYKSDDFQPLLFKTTDYGRTWTKITTGIAPHHFTRVIRADPVRRGLLFAGTENGLYVSLDDGQSWRTFQNNLPIVPVTDLAIKNEDLIVATQGRSFWILDDLTRLRQYQIQHLQSPVHFLPTRPVYRMGGGSGNATATAGANLRSEVPLRFHIGNNINVKETAASLVVKDNQGVVIKTYSTKPQKGEDKLELKSGFNELGWNLRYAAAETFDGMILWGGGTQGPLAAPGKYLAELKVADHVVELPFEILRDPRSTSSDEDLKAQFDFLISVRDKLSETHRSIRQIREVRSQLETFMNRIKDQESFKPIVESGKQIVAKLTEIEEALYQTKNRSGQDPLNYPIRLNNRLSGLVSVVASGNFRPADSAYQVRDLVVQLIDEQLGKLRQILDQDIPAFNNQVNELRVPVISIGDGK